MARLFSLFMLLAFLAGCTATAKNRPMKAGDPSALPPRFLMQGHTFLADPAKHERTIDLMKAAGVEMIRDEAYWHIVEERKGALEIPNRVRRNVDYTVRQGIEPLLILNYANPHYDDDMAPHTEEGRAAFARYCAFLAREFRGKVRYFEVWNEPNLDGFWRPRSNASDYAELLKAAYQAVKTEQPGATVVAGALSQIDREFTNAVLEAGAWPYFDAWSVHPYITPRSPAQANLWQNLKGIRDLVAEYGGAKPVWVTECGYPTSPGVNTEAHQANMVARVYAGSMEHDWLPVFGWYWFGPDGPDPENVEDRFGLIRSDWTRKPAYWAHATVASLLGDASYQEALNLGAPLMGHRFVREDDSQAAMLWSTGDRAQVRINTKDPVTVVLRGGAQIPMQPSDGVILLDVSQAPIYILSDSLLAMEPIEDPALRLEAARELSSSGPALVTLTNRPTPDPSGQWDRIRRVRWEWEAREDIELEAVEPPDGEENLTTTRFALRAMPTAARGADELALLLRPVNGERPFARLLQPVNVLTAASVYASPLYDEAGQSRRAEITVVDELYGKDFGLTKTGDSALYEVFVEGEGGVEAVPSYFQIRSGERRKTYSQEVSIRGDLAPDEVVFLKITVQTANGETITERGHVAFMTSPRRQQPITIDGSLSDWPQHPPIRLDKKEQLVSQWRPWGGPEDASARVYTAWDDEFLYIAAEVTDDDLSGPVEGFEMYKNDGVEVYVDAKFQEDRLEQRYSADDNQFGFFYEAGKPVVFRWSHGGTYWPEGRVALNQQPTSKETVGGGTVPSYILEGAVPLKTLQLEPGSGKIIGFGAALSDDDDPRTIHPFGQEVQLNWSTLKQSFRNPRRFGQLILVEGTQP